MKPNDAHHWTITCIGYSKCGKQLVKSTEFAGTVDGVMGYADEFESEVEFEVLQFQITRGLKV